MEVDLPQKLVVQNIALVGIGIIYTQGSNIVSFQFIHFYTLLKELIFVLCYREFLERRRRILKGVSCSTNMKLIQVGFKLNLTSHVKELLSVWEELIQLFEVLGLCQ